MSNVADENEAIIKAQEKLQHFVDAVLPQKIKDIDHILENPDFNASVYAVLNQNLRSISQLKDILRQSSSIIYRRRFADQRFRQRYFCIHQPG